MKQVTVTPEMVAKLPKWAQEHIEALSRERFVAQRALTEFSDMQSKTNVWFEDHVCLGPGGPKEFRRYLQTNRISFQLDGDEVAIYLREDGDEQVLDISSGWNTLFVQPQASNVLRIVPKSKIKGGR